MLTGTTLGPYRVLELLGEGGMGQVYRARDTKLDRDVAIKSVPEAFARDPERLARFQREAKTESDFSCSRTSKPPLAPSRLRQRFTSSSTGRRS